MSELFLIETYSKPHIAIVKDRAVTFGGQDFHVHTGSEASLVQDIRDGQIEHVQSVLRINRDEGTCRDVTEDIAIAVRQKLHDQFETVPVFLENFLSQVEGVNA